MRYEVHVRVLPSDGGFAGETRKVEVEAPNAWTAIAAAILKLDDEGITHVIVDSPDKAVRCVTN